ncbi:ATPase inhibitor, mitochondrial-like [Nycticebus coucang]|uniref:ATPase inhibitor, mitochondrial-like n=1 Tax=Nycticebus coucang TaxID=9470 RepID=UPI00234DFB6E|nr:ATPase inhibitor, mitochondrial-like [Nycticebus coucang]
MAVSALVMRSQFGMWGVKALQARGFAPDQPNDIDRREGSIREAGGVFCKKERAEEERYFRAQAKEQLARLQKHHEDEISHHKREIERLQKEIERHQQVKMLSHQD